MSSRFTAGALGANIGDTGVREVLRERRRLKTRFLLILAPGNSLDTQSNTTSLGSMLVIGSFGSAVSCHCTIASDKQSANPATKVSLSNPFPSSRHPLAHLGNQAGRMAGKNCRLAVVLTDFFVDLPVVFVVEVMLLVVLLVTVIFAVDVFLVVEVLDLVDVVDLEVVENAGLVESADCVAPAITLVRSMTNDDFATDRLFSVFSVDFPVDFSVDKDLLDRDVLVREMVLKRVRV
jgi:hypothetical protein